MQTTRIETIAREMNISMVGVFEISEAHHFFFYYSHIFHLYRNIADNCTMFNEKTQTPKVCIVLFARSLSFPTRHPIVHISFGSSIQFYSVKWRCARKCNGKPWIAIHFHRSRDISSRETERHFYFWSFMFYLDWHIENCQAIHNPDQLIFVLTFNLDLLAKCLIEIA